MKDWWVSIKGSWMETVIYVVLGVVIALVANVGLGYALNTDTPVVAVFSGSMYHGLDDSSVLCGFTVGSAKGFDDYWDVCGGWYVENGVSKDVFESWGISEGFAKGDMIIVQNTGEVGLGDIIVFDTRDFGYPIIHRVVGIRDNGTLITKGDHNSAGDPWETNPESIHGKAVLKLPFLGWVKVLFVDLFG